jgi:hypothetical protein
MTLLSESNVKGSTKACVEPGCHRSRWSNLLLLARCRSFFLADFGATFATKIGTQRSAALRGHVRNMAVI